MLPHFMTSFESLVKCNFNSEIHRSIALFVTYAFHTPSASSARPRRPSTGTRRSNSPVPAVPGACRRPTLELTGAWSAGTINASRLLSRRQLGVKMLEMYTRLLCERDKLDDVRRFAKTVTNKVTHPRKRPRGREMNGGKGRRTDVPAVAALPARRRGPRGRRLRMPDHGAPARDAAAGLLQQVRCQDRRLRHHGAPSQAVVGHPDSLAHPVQHPLWLRRGQDRL